MDWKEFIKPNKRKFVILLSLIVLSIFLLSISFIEDFFRIFLIPITTWPIDFFNLITNSAFKPTSCGFLCFPTIPQLLFVLVFDIIFLYLLASVIYLMLSKKNKIN